jgi:WD40 repeat protein
MFSAVRSPRSLQIHITESFGVTGGADQVLRVWPLNFSESFLEASHDGPIGAVGVSPDGTKVAAGTTTGNLGVLDVRSKQYSTVMRSHTRPIVAVVVHPALPGFATLSEDGYVDVWDGETMAQLCQFQASDDLPISGAYHPQQNTLVCGYTSGAVRVYAVEATEVCCSRHQHTAKATHVVFSPDGERLFSAGQDGLLVLYDPLQDYVATRVINFAAPGVISIALNAAGTQLAYTGPEPHMITVIHGTTLDEITCFEPSRNRFSGQPPSRVALRRIAFAPTADAIYTLAADGRVALVDAKDGGILEQLPRQPHPPANALVTHPAGGCVVTGGQDHAIRVWDAWLRSAVESQMFLGHGDAIRDLAFTNNGKQLISVGDAIYRWSFLGSSAPQSRPAILGGDTVDAVDVDASGSSPDDTAAAARPPPPPYPDDSPPDGVAADGRGSMLASRLDDVGAGRGSNPAIFPAAADAAAADADAAPPVPPFGDEWRVDGSRGPARSGSGGDDTGESHATEVLDRTSAPKRDRGREPEPEPFPVAHDAWPTVHDGYAGWPTQLAAVPAVQQLPQVHSHYPGKIATSELAEKRYTVATNQEGIAVGTVFGHTSRGRNNALWHAQTGLFVY